MGVVKAIITIIQFLPELIGLIRSLVGRVEDGVETARLKRDIKRISNAFQATNRAEAARALNEVFRGD